MGKISFIRKDYLGEELGLVTNIACILFVSLAIFAYIQNKPSDISGFEAHSRHVESLQKMSALLIEKNCRHNVRNFDSNSSTVFPLRGYTDSFHALTLKTPITYFCADRTKVVSNIVVLEQYAPLTEIKTISHATSTRTLILKTP